MFVIFFIYIYIRCRRRSRCSRSWSTLPCRSCFITLRREIRSNIPFAENTPHKIKEQTRLTHRFEKELK